MNRHERRAQKRKKRLATSPTSNEDATQQPQESFSKSEHLGPGPDLRELRNSGANPQDRSQSNRGGILARSFAKILLSDWVIARVNHPEAERLLLSLAFETGRNDAIDRIVRKQALRGHIQQ
ncbi:MAG: hypothetical protein KDE14_09080 [Rhodobacteraceae bacterium]|nr:hypothetical protein [Paracoccaceae bacterium]